MQRLNERNDIKLTDLNELYANKYLIVLSLECINPVKRASNYVTLLHYKALHLPLVLVKKVKSLLASLQPNLFLAWTRHSYSDSGSRPEMR